MPAKRPPTATVSTAADAYALGYWPGVSLLSLLGQALLDPLAADDDAGPSTAAAGLAAARAILAQPAKLAETAAIELRQLASQHGLERVEWPAAAPRPTTGKVLAPHYRAWLDQTRRDGRAITARSLQDVFSLGEAVADLQLALWLAQALLSLAGLSPSLAPRPPQLPTLLGELEHARNNAAQRLILTLGSPQLPVPLAAYGPALTAPLLGAPNGLAALSDAEAAAYAEWLAALLTLLREVTAIAIGHR